MTWPGVRVIEVDKSCFKSFAGLRSFLLNQALARDFVEGGHDDHVGTLQIWTRPSGKRHSISLALETNKHQAAMLPCPGRMCNFNL